MKEIIKVKLNVRKVDLIKCKTELLCIGFFSDVKGLDKSTKELDKALNGDIEKLIKLGDFKGKESTTAIIYGNENIGAKRVLLVGLGEKKKATLNTIRKAAGCAAKKAVEMKIDNISLSLHRAFSPRFDLSAIGQVCGEGVHLGSYRYDEFVTKEEENGRLESLSIEVIEADAGKQKKLATGIKRGDIIGQSQNYARTIANRPGNVINPPSLAAEARKMVKGFVNLSCSVIDDKQLSKMGMGGILAVGSGSSSKPRLIIIRYTPPRVKKGTAAIGLVGKAITFDSGGISIKSAKGMQEMKFDKSGGIAVLGAMKAISQLKPALIVYGIIPSAENIPGPTSYRPGDIITTFSGKTVEIQNTDAEGRMILCDALHYAVTQNCEVIVDIATLTGACVVALGNHKAALMGNNDRLIKQLQKASQLSGESVWHMPCGDEYLEEMKSKIADLKNIGSRWGGACTAAAFLGEFVGEAKWVHIDMAPFMSDDGKKGDAVGSIGYGVRLLTAFVTNTANKK